MEKAILDFANDFNLVKKGKKTGRPVYKDYDCKFCGEKNPDNFNTKYKTTCKKCKISKATEKYHTEKITEEDVKIKKFIDYFYEEFEREFKNNIDDENKLLDEFDEEIINNLLNNCIYNKIDRTLKTTYKVLKMEFKN
jgi:hypothetical protein